MMVDAAGQLRPVYGVAGNFVLGVPGVAEVPEAATELRLAHAVVFVREAELVVRRVDASEVRFALEGLHGLRVMSADWVQVIVGTRSYALRVEHGREALFALPTTGARRR
jgi:hypothetical protein